MRAPFHNLNHYRLPKLLLSTTIIFRQMFQTQSSFTLITFDVDGTLVKGSGNAMEISAHSRAYGIGVDRIFGKNDGSAPPNVSQTLHTRDYHGSTDGLILLRLARAALGVEPSSSAPRLNEMMDVMHEHISTLSDEDVSRGINVLPGVLDHLDTLSKMSESVACGLVTGNVEGIARRKMKAVGVWDTGALALPSTDQRKRIWKGTEDIAFLGGFGSDFCSGDIDDAARNYLDRGEQIAIATRRCRESHPQKILKRVVHVGDAPADVLAAKAFSQSEESDLLCVGMVAVATGSYGADELRDLAGDTIPGKWEPVVLDDGMANPSFLNACGIV